MDIALSEIIFRLGAAVLAGSAIGLNRNLRGKSAGLRTHALVCLGSALITLAGIELSGADTGAVLRVVQGVITGIGFLGAGVILRSQKAKRVLGLTTAATIWLAACFGIACGAGEWTLVLVALVLTLVVLVLGGPFERLIDGVILRVTGQKVVRTDTQPAGTQPSTDTADVQSR